MGVGGVGTYPNGKLFRVLRFFQRACLPLGLKPLVITAANAALKRRSSTVFGPDPNPFRSEAGGDGVGTVSILVGSVIQI